MKPKLLYLISEDWFFCSHFIERAVAASKAGYHVIVVCREKKHGDQIRAAGLQYIPVEFSRCSMNILRELRLLFIIWRIYMRERPDIVHHVAIKPILYGSLVAKLAKVQSIVNAPVGMGYIFSSSDLITRLLRPFVLFGYKVLMNPYGSFVIFENSDDLNTFVDRGIVKRSAALLIRGAGVNLQSFCPGIEHSGTIVVMFIARMLKDKGVVEFVTAARQLYEDKVLARFILIGGSDAENPTSISEETLRGWHGHDGVEWWGWCEDMGSVLQQAHIICLPSYREGLPRALIEALACGLPVVTTDVVGCREVVVDGENGFLVPVKNVKELFLALKKLIKNPVLRRRMGQRGRIKAETEFSSSRVIAETLAVYNRFPVSRYF